MLEKCELLRIFASHEKIVIFQRLSPILELRNSKNSPSPLTYLSKIIKATNMCGRLLCSGAHFTSQVLLQALLCISPPFLAFTLCSLLSQESVVKNRCWNRKKVHLARPLLLPFQMHSNKILLNTPATKILYNKSHSNSLILHSEWQRQTEPKYIKYG